MASKSPMKIKSFQENIQIELLAQGKLVYSYANKLSDSGISKNTRLLMMDTISGVIGYYNQDAIPRVPIQTHENMKQMKKKAPLAFVGCRKLKNQPAIQLKTNRVQYKGKTSQKEQKWTFSFKNMQMAEGWVREIEEAKKLIAERSTMGPELKGNVNINPQTSNNSNQIPVKPIENNPVPIDQKHSLGSELTPVVVDTSFHPSSVAPLRAEENRIDSKVVSAGLGIGSSEIKMTGSAIVPNSVSNSKIEGNNTPAPFLQSLKKTQPQKFEMGSSSRQPTALQPVNTFSLHSSNFKNSSQLAQYNVGKASVYQIGVDRDWNGQFVGSSNPLEVLMEFRANAEATVKSIIDELGADQSKRRHKPLMSQPFESYVVGSLIVNLVFLTAEDIEHKRLKNQFRNYNYILNSTQNSQPIKVPLAAVVNYKGVTAFVKARIPKSQQVNFDTIYDEVAQLEKTTKIDKEVLRTNGVFYKVATSTSSYIFVDELKEYMPFDVQATDQCCQLRGEFLITSEDNLPGGQFTGKKSDKSNRGFAQLDEASRRMRECGCEVTKMMQNMDLVILNTIEMTKHFHLNGISMRCLGLFYGQCGNPLLRKYLISEMASRACKKLLRSQLQKQIKKSQMSFSHVSSAQSPNNMVLLDIAFSVLNDIVSQNNRTDEIWKLVASQVKRKYNVTFSRQDLSVGYFLSSLFHKSGLTFDYQYLSKDKHYFKTSNALRRELITGFRADTDTFDIGFTYQYRRLTQILNGEPTQQGFHQLVELLGLRAAGIPDYCYVYKLDERIKWYMGNYIPYGSQEYRLVDVYSGVGQQPPTEHSIKQSLLAMKWLRKNPNDQNGNAIFEIATDLISFWGGQYHPLLSYLYDFVVESQTNAGNYESALALAKSSLTNYLHVSGSNTLASSEKYYKLADIYFRMGKKQEALKNYQITRQIFQVNKNTNINEYGQVALKLALLNLNFSKNSEAASKALEALRIFEQTPIQEEGMLEAYEVLTRVYQTSNQKAELLHLSSLCSKRLPTISNSKVYERMLKIVVYPQLVSLSSSTAQDLQKIYRQLPKGANQHQALEFLKSKTTQHSGLGFQDKLQRIDKTLADINKRSLITSAYKGLSSANQGEAEEFLGYLEAIGTILGDSFIMGVLMEAGQ